MTSVRAGYDGKTVSILHGKEPVAMAWVRKYMVFKELQHNSMPASPAWQQEESLPFGQSCTDGHACITVLPNNTSHQQFLETP